VYINRIYPKKCKIILNIGIYYNMSSSITRLIGAITCWSVKTVIKVLLFIIFTPMNLLIWGIKKKIRNAIDETIMNLKATVWMFSIVLIWSLLNKISSGGGQSGGNQTVKEKFYKLIDYTNTTIENITPDKFIEIVKDIETGFDVKFETDSEQKISDNIKTKVEKLLDSYFKEGSESCPRGSNKATEDDLKGAMKEYKEEVEEEGQEFMGDTYHDAHEGGAKGKKSRKARKSKKSRKSKKTRKNKKTRKTKKR